MSLQFWNHTKWIYHYFSTEISALFPNKMNLRIIGCWYKKNQRLSRHQPCSLGGDLKIPLSCINAFIRMFIHSHIHSFAYVVVLTHTHTMCTESFPARPWWPTLTTRSTNQRVQRHAWSSFVLTRQPRGVYRMCIFRDAIVFTMLLFITTILSYRVIYVLSIFFKFWSIRFGI